MRSIAFLIFLFYIGELLSQTPHYTLSGNVTSCKTNEPLKNVTMRLVGSDGISVETKTDSLGNYEFESSSIKEKTKYVLSTEAKGAKGSNKDAQFLNSSEKYQFSTDTVDEKHHFITNYCLAQGFACEPPAPVFFFEKNATIFNNLNYRDSNYTFQNEFTVLAETLTEEPSIVLEIAGHANYDEENPLELSIRRAQIVKDSLVKRGVDEKRLKVKGYSSLRPLKIGEGVFINQKYVRRLKAVEEKEAALQRDRRVVMRISSWDYPDPKQKELYQKLKVKNNE